MSRYLRSRVERLKVQIPPPIDGDAALRQAVLRDVLVEFGRLKASRAMGYRGGVPIEPENIPGKVLGPTYTTGQMMELAIRRVFEREGVPDERLEELVQRWVGVFERWFVRQGRDWNKMEGEG